MDLSDLKKLAGINEYKGQHEYSVENMSHTASELKAKEQKLGIKPGDKEWFELWFSKPYLTGHSFRGRNTK